MPDNKESSVSRIRHIVSSDFLREVISLFLPTTEKLTVLQLLFIAYYINAIGQRIYQNLPSEVEVAMTKKFFRHEGRPHLIRVNSVPRYNRRMFMFTKFVV